MTHYLVSRRTALKVGAGVAAMPLVHIRTVRAANQKTFIMGYDPTGPTCHLGQYAALVKGFFAEEGLRVQGVAALDNRTAVAQGRSHRLWIKTDAGVTEADIGYFDTDQLHNMVAGTVDYYIVDGNHFGCWSVMVPPDSPVQSVADLKGKTIEIGAYAVSGCLPSDIAQSSARSVSVSLRVNCARDPWI
jgi:ABC-type nitrate/sulfonate/bicarbonate transport system substrate-binding protein